MTDAIANSAATRTATHGTTVRGGNGPLGLIADTLRLWFRFLPQLLAIALLGVVARVLLLEAAVSLGFLNHLAGLIFLTIVVLVKLVVIVALFETLRPALPAMKYAATSGEEPSDTAKATSQDEVPAASAMTARQRLTAGTTRVATILSLALVPFFAYYTAWGFLGDTIRDYSRLALTRDPFGEHGMVLDVSGGLWLILSVALLWLVRRIAKALAKRSTSSLWNLLIVMCEAGWAFIGLYVISQWKGGLIGWFATHNIADYLIDGWHDFLSLIGTAHAAGTPVPVEQTPPGLKSTIVEIFFYGLLPVVWLTIAALIYRYDVHRMGDAELTAGSPRLERLLLRYRGVPKFLRDFLEHFTKGTAKRYWALASSVRLTFASGLMALLAMIVLYRAIDWASAWAWLGLARLIGPHSIAVWESIAGQIGLLLGSPSYPGDGILPMTLKICLLAAALERSFAAGRKWQRLG